MKAFQVNAQRRLQGVHPENKATVLPAAYFGLPLGGEQAILCLSHLAGLGRWETIFQPGLWSRREFVWFVTPLATAGDSATGVPAGTGRPIVFAWIAD